MIGPGDLAIRDLDDAERGCRTCRECDSLYPDEDGRASLCPDCDARMRPLCACGQPGACVVDIYVDTLLIERSPVCSEACALGEVDEAHPSLIDTVVDAASLSAVIAVAPCWCKMRETTVVDWCPKCGVSEPAKIS